MITVFTPTYNRASLLPRLYNSLLKQAFKNFEWIVVDDGSTDDTEKVMKDIMAADHSFSVRYIKTPNGGKHRAVNRGVKEAKGELFFIADSDDILPHDALENVLTVYSQIQDDQSFAGVCGLDGDLDGKVIGSGLSQEVIDGSPIAVRFKLGVTGDMKEVFRTSVMKEFPFPEIDGEKFCPEVLVWNRIAIKYKLRYFNEIIYLAEYQQDGITSGIVKARMQSPIASMMTYAEMLHYDVPFKQKMKASINYWRFRMCSDRTKQKVNIPWYWNWTVPIGILMHWQDKKSMKIHNTNIRHL